jgi:hypothetical protein
MQLINLLVVVQVQKIQVKQLLLKLVNPVVMLTGLTEMLLVHQVVKVLQEMLLHMVLVQQVVEL